MQEVADHYTHGALETALMEALAVAGRDPERLSVEDLAHVDEFHIGGREATQELAAQLELRPGLQVLDIGCGIGGPARYVATAYGCSVTCIDLTEEFVRVGRNLMTRVGLKEQVRFCRANALAMPLQDNAFDRAYMIHIGMNLPDKAAVFAEAARVLKPDGLFAVYDVVGDGPLKFPVPWADTQAISFVAPLNSYREQLQAAGFTIIAERDRRDYALEFLSRARPAGLRPVMGPNAGEKVANLAAAIAEGAVRPVEMIARC